MKTTPYLLSEDEKVILPVGFYRDGTFYREVIIDEFKAVDQEILTTPSAKNNPARAMSMILARVIQEIPGVMPKKADPEKRIEDSWVQKMFSADRDTVLWQSLLLADDEPKISETKCEKCGQELEISMDLKTLQIYPHDHTNPPVIAFELPRGIKSKNKEGEAVVIKKGELRLMTGRDYENLASKANQGELAMITHNLAALSQNVEHIGSFGLTELRQMSLKDRRVLMDALGELAPGPDVIRDEECISCGHKFKMNLDISRFFF